MKFCNSRRILGIYSQGLLILRFQIQPVLRSAWFSLGVEFSPDEHLRQIPPLPLSLTPATLATLDLWTIYFHQNNEALLY